MACRKKEKNEGADLVLRNEVYQGNPLINSRKVFDLLGMRIFLVGLMGLNPHFSKQDKYYDKEFPELFIPTRKLTELFGNTWYLGELKPACKKLFDTVIELNSTNGGYKLYHLFRKLKYEPGKGLYLQFDELLRPYILDLVEQTKGYTRIRAEYLFKLSSPYAVRLLELLLQYQNIKLFKDLMEIKRKLTIEELRFSLNVPEGAYKNRMDHFKKFVLDNPIREINTRTPYIVSYENVKEGRKVVALEFTVDTSSVPKDGENDYKFKRGCDAIKALCSLGFTEETARAIFAKCSDEADCFSRLNRAQAVLSRSKRPVKNKLGFLRKAIEENWQVGRESSRRTEQIEARTNDSMASLGDIFKSIPIMPLMPPVQAEEVPQPTVPMKPQAINIGKKRIQLGLAETFMKYIRRGEMLDLIRESLKTYNTTVEKFTEICEKNGL